MLTVKLPSSERAGLLGGTAALAGAGGSAVGTLTGAAVGAGGSAAGTLTVVAVGAAGSAAGTLTGVATGLPRGAGFSVSGIGFLASGHSFLGSGLGLGLGLRFSAFGGDGGLAAAGASDLGFAGPAGFVAAAFFSCSATILPTRFRRLLISSPIPSWLAEGPNLK